MSVIYTTLQLKEKLDGLQEQLDRSQEKGGMCITITEEECVELFDVLGDAHNLLELIQDHPVCEDEDCELCT